MNSANMVMQQPMSQQAPPDNQSALLQKLFEEMNNKNDSAVDAENQELLQKIEKIERENANLANGIGPYYHLFISRIPIEHH